MKSALQPHLGKEQSQESYPTVLSQLHTKELKQLPHPKIDQNKQVSCAQEYYQQTHKETQTELTGENLSLTKKACKVWKRRLIT